MKLEQEFESNPRINMNQIKLQTQDGTELFLRYWMPEADVKAVVIHSHGLGEHCGRWEHVAEFFKSHDVAFLSFDHRGHGRSGGKRGHIPNYEALMEELDLVFAKANDLFPGIPQILYGHSWGGNIVANYLLRRQPSVLGAIVTGPWLKLPPEQAPSAFLEFMAKIMNVIFPTFTESNQIDASMLSYDLSVGEAYVKDPLVHGKTTARLYISTAEAAEFALDRAMQLHVPTLMLHGADDRITDPAGTTQFAREAGDKATLEVFENMRHEIHNEVDKQRVLEQLMDFIDNLLR